MNFRIGQPVVCVNARASHGRIWKGDIPCEGSRYTIVDIVMTDDPFDGRKVSLILDEIKNSPCWGGAYAAFRFRPVTDISCFTAMLNEKQRERSLCGND